MGKKNKRKKSPSGEKSIEWVVAAIMIVIGVFAWALMAAGYAHSEEGWRSGGVAESEMPVRTSRGTVQRHFVQSSLKAFAQLCANAVVQVPNVFSVIGFTIKNRLWLLIVVAVLEGLCVVGGVKMKQLEAELAKTRVDR